MSIHITHGIFTGHTVDEQIERENTDKLQGVREYKKIVATVTRRGEASHLAPSQRMMRHWFKVINDCVAYEMRQCNAGKVQFGRAEYARIFEIVSKELVTVTALRVVMDEIGSSPDGMTWRKLAFRIGNNVLGECNWKTLKAFAAKQNRAFRDSIKGLDEEGRYEAAKKHTSTVDVLQSTVRKLNPGQVNRYIKRHHGDIAFWQAKTCLALGSVLLHYIVRECSATDYAHMQHAFEKHVVRTATADGVTSVPHVRPTPALVAAIEESHYLRQWGRPLTRPMICTPASWSTGRGGWYTIRRPLVTKTTELQRALLDDAEMPRVYEAVDAINATQQAINPFILDVQEQIYAAGGGHAGIPRSDDLPMPEAEGLEGDALKAHKRRRHQTYTKNIGMRGSRKLFLSVQRTAKDLLHRPGHWCPHMLDTRGRIYNQVNAPNHQKSDMDRSMVLFAEPKPLGPNGRRAIKLHLAGMLDYDKCSLDERERFVDANMDTFQAWAEDPLEHTGWMNDITGKRNKKKALQALAAARALFDDDLAQRLPVQLDGSCNGLQHYAAMSRCLETARLVNLLPSSPTGVPERVYTDVANATKPLVEMDAIGDLPVAKQLLDVVPIDDKLAKQPTMTKVYGVTKVGMREQLYKMFEDYESMARIERYRMAVYASEKVHAALGNVCRKAVECMDIMQGWARAYAKARHPQPVQWVTPLGFPVLQEYYQRTDKEIATMGGKFQIDRRNRPLIPAAGKQIDAVAPNFVHSIDSTHLMMVAIACRSKEIPLMTVHDSYWCRAGDAEAMHRIIREQFVALHSQPLVHDLHDQLKRQRPDLRLADPPELGEYNIQDICQSVYAFA